MGYFLIGFISFFLFVVIPIKYSIYWKLEKSDKEKDRIMSNTGSNNLNEQWPLKPKKVKMTLPTILGNILIAFFSGVMTAWFVAMVMTASYALYYSEFSSGQVNAGDALTIFYGSVLVGLAAFILSLFLLFILKPRKDTKYQAELEELRKQGAENEKKRKIKVAQKKKEEEDQLKQLTKKKEDQLKQLIIGIAKAVAQDELEKYKQQNEEN